MDEDGTLVALIMRSPKIDFLNSGYEDEPPRGHARKRSKFLLTFISIFTIFVVSFGFGRLTLSGDPGDESPWESIPFLGTMGRLISSPDRKIRGEADDRINILLLGMGGEGHEGPLLTDTLMVASIKPSTNQVALLSIPRDLIVPLADIGWRKINSANAYGELRSPGRGGDFTRTVVEGLLGIGIPYYVRVDFDGFREIIDGVGGIDVYVDRTFTDYTYPTENYLTQAISFTQGWQRMTGEDALRFARSRHGTNGEGTDFARARRQQKVLAALKDTLLDYKSFKSPSAISNTLAALQSNIATNFQIGDILRLAKMAQNVSPEGVKHKVLDNRADSPLVDAMLDGAYVLVPKNDDWNGIRLVAERLFDEATPEPAAPPPLPAAAKPKVEIRNGTAIAGLAREVSAKIASKGFQVTKIGNADRETYAATVIYDLTKGTRTTDLERLRDAVSGAVATKKVPSALALTLSDSTDFLVILGAAGE